jgi:biopolymer transport protein ExbB/TolQ
MLSKRAKFGLAAVGICVLLLALTFLLPESSRFGVTFFDRRSSVYPFTVQNAMWVFFFLGLGELCSRIDDIKENSRGLKAGYLSDRPDVFYAREDIVEIRKKTHNKNDLPARLINTLTIRYQISNWAVDETHQMLNSQLELIQFRQDAEYGLIRFITWLLPTLGFIGTVMGISDGLNKAGVPGASETPDFIPNLTKSLAFAFDTTLVALLMSAVLVYLIHLIQSQEAHSLERCGAYCLENFINKLMSKV